MPGSWAELQLVLHHLGLIFDGLRDDLVRLDGVVLAALPLVVSLLSGIRSGLQASQRKRSKAKRQKARLGCAMPVALNKRSRAIMNLSAKRRPLSSSIN